MKCSGCGTSIGRTPEGVKSVVLEVRSRIAGPQAVGRRKRLPHNNASPCAPKWDRRFRLSTRRSQRLFLLACARFSDHCDQRASACWPGRDREGAILAEYETAFMKRGVK